MRIFQKTVIAIFCTFMALMIIVIITAYSRHSGHTRINMAKVQEMRHAGSSG